MNKATQTGPRLVWEPTIPLRRGTSAPARWPDHHHLPVPAAPPQTSHSVQLHQCRAPFCQAETLPLSSLTSALTIRRS